LGIRSLRPSEARAIAAEWNGRAKRPADGPRARSLATDLRRAMRRLRPPAGPDLAALAESALAGPAPSWAADLPPGLTPLAKLCPAGERHGGGPGWPVWARLAARALGVGRSTAHRLLTALVAAGALAVHTPGRRGPGKRPATTWQLVHTTGRHAP